MAIDAMGEVVGGAVSTYFYNAKVDKTRDAVQKVLGQIETMSQNLLTQGFTGLSLQQMEFFNNARLLLLNFKTVYADSLDRTVESIGREASTQLSQIDAMVHNWTSGNPDMAGTVTTVVALATNLINKVNDSPQIMSFSPTFVAPLQKDGFVIIECVGIFPAVLSPEMEPKLVAHNNTYPTTDHTTGMIRFSVPFKALFPDNPQTSGPVRRAAYTVQIPHLQKGRIWNTRADHEYKGSVTLLPESAGKIILQSAQVEKVVEQKVITSESIKQTSRPYGFNKTELNHPYTLSTEPGWEIVPGSTKMIIEGNKGKTAWTLLHDNPSQVTWGVSTYKYKPVKHCGKIRFRISALAKRTLETKYTSEKEIRLKWGDSLEIGHAGAVFSVTLHGFDGTTQALVANTYEKYVDYVVRNGKVILSVKPPEKISSYPFQ